MRALASILVVLAGALGCGSEESTPTTSDGGLDEAWEAFVAEDFGTAASAFDRALSEDASDGEARLGAGWTALITAGSVSEIEGAIGHFDRALVDGADPEDVRAGRALALLARGGSFADDARSDAEAVLAADAAYRFPYRPTVDDRVLDFVRAAAALAAGDFEDALTIADTIDASTVDPTDAETWQVDGVPRRTLAAIAGARLQSLSERLPR